MQNAQQVIAAVIQREGKYLICRRAENKRLGGFWEFPGGKLEAGESMLDAARRELQEELALAVTSIGDTIYATTDSASGFIINFVAVETNGSPQLLEHSALAWATETELKRYELAPSDLLFADYLCDNAD